MQIRCYRCGNSFAINKEEAAFALKALEETGGTHYDTRCPKCRHDNRVSLEQLRRAAPKPAPEVSAQTQSPKDEPAKDEPAEDEPATAS